MGLLKTNQGRRPIPQMSWMGNALKRQWCHAVDRYDEGLNVIQLEWYAQHWRAYLTAAAAFPLLTHTHSYRLSHVSTHTHTLSQTCSCFRIIVKLVGGHVSWVQCPDCLMISPPRSSIKRSPSEVWVRVLACGFSILIFQCIKNCMCFKVLCSTVIINDKWFLSSLSCSIILSCSSLHHPFQIFINKFVMLASQCTSVKEWMSLSKCV